MHVCLCRCQSPTASTVASVGATCKHLRPERALLCCHPCTLQEEFKSVVKDHRGFEYRPERPNGTNFVQQKFGWTGLQLGEVYTNSSVRHHCGDRTSWFCGQAVRACCLQGVLTAPPGVAAGDWAELEVDTRAGASRVAVAAGEAHTSRIHLAYLISYTDMGTALVKCISGCTCEPQKVVTSWPLLASTQQVLVFEVGWLDRVLCPL